MEICGDEDAVANVLVAENRRRRLESITATSAGNADFFASGRVKAGGDWVSSLPMRFRRELELERAQAKVKDLQSELGDLTDHLQAVEGQHTQERDAMKRAELKVLEEKDMVQLELDMAHKRAESEREEFKRMERRMKDEKQRMQNAQLELQEEQDEHRANASHMQQLMLQQKQESQMMYQQVKDLEEKLSSSMHSLQIAEDQIGELKERETFQNDQLQSVILARNAKDEDVVAANKKVRALEMQKKRGDKQLQALKRQMEQIGKKAEEDQESLRVEAARQALVIEEKDALVQSLQEEIIKSKDAPVEESKEAKESEEEISLLKKKLRAAVKKGKGIEQKWQDEKERADQSEVAASAMKEKIAELEAAHATGVPSGTGEAQQVIVDLEAKLEAEKARANESEAAASAMMLRISELEAHKERAEESEAACSALMVKVSELEAEKNAALGNAEDSQEKQQVIADLEAKLEAENERANESEETCSALKETISELEAEKNAALGNAEDSQEKQQVIADLEAKLEAQTERADESESTCSALKERVAEMEAQKETVQASNGEGPADQDHVIADLEAKFKAEREKLRAAVRKGKSIEQKLLAERQSAGERESAASALQESLREKILELEAAQDVLPVGSDAADQQPQIADQQPQIADLEAKLEEQRARADQNEAEASALRERFGEMMALEQTQAIAEDEAVEQQQRIAELESRLRVERERADQSQNVSSRLGEKVALMESRQRDLEEMLREIQPNVVLPEQEAPPPIQEKQNEGQNLIQPMEPKLGDSEEDEEDVKLDEALKTAGANLWNWVSGS